MLIAALLTMSLITAPADPACTTQAGSQPVAARTSKYDSTSMTVGKAMVKVCYSRPAMRGRKIFGTALVPHDQIWRTGANEPAIIHTTGPIAVAGIRLAAGSYSLYTVPSEKNKWKVVLNRSTSQWGSESDYDTVKAQEVGRAAVTAVRNAPTSELFTMMSSGGTKSGTLILTWENTRVSVPIKASK